MSSAPTTRERARADPSSAPRRPPYYSILRSLSPPRARALARARVGDENVSALSPLLTTCLALRMNSIRRSTTGHNSWTEEGGNPDDAKVQNSQRTSLNGFDIATPASRAIKRRAFELLRIDQYDEHMADGIQVPRCEPSSRPLSGMKLSRAPPPSSSRKVLRYEQRQAYVAHTDYFNYKTSADHNWDPRAGGTRPHGDALPVSLRRRARRPDGLPARRAQRARTRCCTAGRRPRRPPRRRSSSRTRAGRQAHARLLPPVRRHAAQGRRDPVLLAEGGRELDVMSLHGGETTTGERPPRSRAIALAGVERQLTRALLPPSSLCPSRKGCPVLEGTKWAANLWVWNGRRYGV